MAETAPLVDRRGLGALPALQWARETTAEPPGASGLGRYIVLAVRRTRMAVDYAGERHSMNTELEGSWNVTKPHLRLHYVPDARNPSAKKYPWYVERLGERTRRGACVTTMLMGTSGDAVRAARTIWWGLY